MESDQGKTWRQLIDDALGQTTDPSEIKRLRDTMMSTKDELTRRLKA